MKKILILVSAFAIVSCSPSSTESTEKTASEMDKAEVVEEVIPEESNGVSFLNMEEGAMLTSPFLLEMGVNGMEVEPKGAPREGFGHHHLIINEGAAPQGTVIVADATHIHYGGGQTSDSVSLEPGDYLLTLQFADGMHVSYGEPWSRSINVTVK